MKDRKTLWLPILGIVLGLVGLWLCISGAGMYRYFLEIHAVDVEGSVSRIQEQRTDSTVLYDVFVRYTYDEASYETRYVQATTQDQYAIGDGVTLTIDAANPQKTVQMTEFNALSMGLVGSVLMGLGALTVPIHIAPKVQGDFVREMTERVCKRRRYRFLAVTPAVMLLVFMGGNPVILGTAGVLLCLGILDTVRFVRDLRAATHGAMTLRKDTVIGIRMRQSEKALFCTLTLLGKRRYTHQVPKTVYSSYVKDGQVTALYLAGRRPEVLIDPETQQMI